MIEQVWKGCHFWSWREQRNSTTGSRAGQSGEMPLGPAESAGNRTDTLYKGNIFTRLQVSFHKERFPSQEQQFASSKRSKIDHFKWESTFCCHLSDSDHWRSCKVKQRSISSSKRAATWCDNNGKGIPQSLSIGLRN